MFSPVKTKFFTYRKFHIRNYRNCPFQIVNSLEYVESQFFHMFLHYAKLFLKFYPRVVIFTNKLNLGMMV